MLRSLSEHTGPVDWPKLTDPGSLTAEERADEQRRVARVMKNRYVDLNDSITDITAV